MPKYGFLVGSLIVSVLVFSLSSFSSDNKDIGFERNVLSAIESVSSSDRYLAATYYGGSGRDGILGVTTAMDSEGNIYVASRTQSSLNLPTTAGSYQETWGGGSNDVFVAKFNPELTTLISATYLGGSGNEGLWPGLDMKINNEGNIIVAGRTNSDNFPTTPLVLSSSRVGGYDAFISILSPDLSTLIASTYFGGPSNEYFVKLALADNGDIFLAGSTASGTGFPITGGSFDGTYNGNAGSPYPSDLFISRITGDLSNLVASTYLGGSGDEYPEALAVDADGNLFLAGWTSSSNFPTAIAAYDNTFNSGYYDAFVTCLDGSLASLVASTYLGGSGWDFGYALDIANNGEIYIAGHTASTQSSSIPFPITAGVYQTDYHGTGDNSDDVFIAKFNHGLTSLLSSTYYGGSGFENCDALKIGKNNHIYFSGVTNSSDMVILDNTFDPDYDGGSLYTGDAFVAIIDGDLTVQSAFSYLGGTGSECLGSIILDDDNDIFIAGATNSGNFLTTLDAYQVGFAGGGEGEWVDGDNWGGDIFLAKVNFNQFTRLTEGSLVNELATSNSVNWVDYDNDLYPDLFVTNNSTDGTAGTGDYLYHNNHDDTFTRITGQPLTDVSTMTNGSTWADYDNDGDLDVVVIHPRGGANILYENDGMNNFNPVEGTVISEAMVGSRQGSWIDYDLDGDLDLFISNATYSEPDGYPPYRNFLFRNDGGTFTEILTGSIVTQEKHSYGACWSDYDNDGDPDLVIANNGETTDLYRNDGNGIFTRLTSSVVCTESNTGTGSSWGDYDNDGDQDLFISGFYPGPSFLYENNGDGTFSRVIGHGIGNAAGRSDAGLWADYDNDGDLDIFIWHSAYYDPPMTDGRLYRNLGDGTFEWASENYFLGDSCTAMSAAWGDYDHDGDMDIYLARYDQQWLNRPEFLKNALFRNNGNSNYWITIKPIGTKSNKSGIGAKVRIKANIGGFPVWQLREVMTQTGLRGQSPLEAHFGLGDGTIVDSVKVEWPGGQITDILTNVSSNQFLTVTETVCGDVNADSDVNILDIVSLINFKYKGGGAPSPLYAADVNSDGNIDILDIVYLINYKYKGGTKPDCP